MARDRRLRPSDADVIERGPHPRRRRWSAKEIGWLGKMSDAALAKKLGVRHLTVFHERTRRDIAPFRFRRPVVAWTEGMLSLLGADTDRAVAAELELTEAIVQRKRQILGIPPFRPRGGPHRNAKRWLARELDLLGRLPDHEVARRVRLSESAVARKRRNLGIAPFREPSPTTEWKKSDLARLGKESDVRLARQLGVSVGTVRTKRRRLGIQSSRGEKGLFIRRKRALVALTRVPVAQALRRFGISNTTLAKIRAEHGLAVRRWTPTEEALLGTAPDAKIAKRIGRSLTSVRTRRYLLGIPIFAAKPRSDRKPRSN